MNDKVTQGHGEQTEEVERMLAKYPGYEAYINDARISGSPMKLVEMDIRDDISAKGKALPEELEVEETSERQLHMDHKWKRGILPGQKYIKTCSICGLWEAVDFDTWNTLG